MTRFLSEQFRYLEPYVPGEQPQDKAYVKLNTNESPFGPDPGVLKAVQREAERLQLYPDPTGKALKEALAKYYGVAAGNVFLVNGSDEALNYAIMAYCDEILPIAYPDVSYGFYKVFADLYNLPQTVVPLKEDFTIDVDAFCSAKGMAVFANPNAPTGIDLPVSEIERILQSDPDRIVLVDEAYVDFGAESCISLVGKYDNLIVVQTYSKARSMAGARLGFLIADASIVQELEMLRYCTNPYNINRMTMAAGIAALENDAYYKNNCRTIMENRETVREKLEEMGCEVLPSSANFLFAKPPIGTGEEWYLALKEKGVLIRWLKGIRTSSYVRITIGSMEQMKAFLSATREYLKEVQDA